MKIYIELHNCQSEEGARSSCKQKRHQELSGWERVEEPLASLENKLILCGMCKENRQWLSFWKIGFYKEASRVGVDLG